MLKRCTFHLVMLSVCAGASRSESFLPHLPLSLTWIHKHTHTNRLIREKQVQHSCNNSALTVLPSSLRCLHSIINQDSPPFLLSTFCLSAPCILPDLPPTSVFPLVHGCLLSLSRPQISPSQSLHSPHTITPILPSLCIPSLAPALSHCPSLSSQQLAEHVLPLERRASTA